MKIDEKVLNYNRATINLGDALVSPNGYVYLVVCDDQSVAQMESGELDYRLLRLKDGNPDCRKDEEIFEYTLTKKSHANPANFLEKGYRIIPRDKLKLIID